MIKKINKKKQLPKQLLKNSQRNGLNYYFIESSDFDLTFDDDFLIK